MNIKTVENEPVKAIKYRIVPRVAVGIVAWLIVFALVMVRVLPEKHILNTGEIANETITATRDIVDTITTEKKRAAAIENVPDKYRQDDKVTADALAKLQECLAAMDDVTSKGAAEITKFNKGLASATFKDDKGDIQFSQEFFQSCHALLPGSFTDEDVRYIILTDRNKMALLKSKVTTLLTQALKNGIKSDYLQEQVSIVNQELISPLNRFDEGAQRLGMNLVSTYLKANFIFDPAATDAAQKKAGEEVKPEAYKYKQIIVQKGYLVTEAQLKMLSDLGLLDDNNLHLLRYVGVGIFTAMLLLVVWLYMLLFKQEVFHSFRQLLAVNIVIVLTMVAMWLASGLHAYFLLTTTGALLIAVLINHRLALTVNAVLAMLAGILAGSDAGGAFSAAALPAAVAALSGGAVAVYIIRQAPQRATLLFAGLAAGLASMLTVAAVDLMTTSDLQNILIDCGYALGGGLASSMICLGTLPLWEMVFKVVTPMKLLELANPNNTLLKRLLMEAPGTYHHSIVVGNLAESAAEAIGANALLTRTAAYYHDIGKLMRPYFFAENQIGSENPHEAITPELSKRILTAHPKDGMALAIKHSLPQAVQEIIMEHHGTTPVMFFYHKALKQAVDGTQVAMDDYRYPGPKPHTREAALIMLADSVEAGSRALSDHSPEKLDEFVQHIVNSKLEDGQFDNCDLTLRDLGIITAEFRKVLSGIFHERVAYPAIEPSIKKAGTYW